MSLITIDQLLESVELNFEPRFVTKDKNGLVVIWSAKPKILMATSSWEKNDFCEVACYKCLKLAEFEGKDWTECIYEVPQKVKIADKIEELDLSVPNNKMLTDLEQIEIKINQVIDAVNKHADIIQQIGEWGTSKGECLWCETIDKA